MYGDEANKSRYRFTPSPVRAAHVARLGEVEHEIDNISETDTTSSHYDTPGFDTTAPPDSSPRTEVPNVSFQYQPLVFVPGSTSNLTDPLFVEVASLHHQSPNYDAYGTLQVKEHSEHLTRASTTTSPSPSAGPDRLADPDATTTNVSSSESFNTSPPSTPLSDKTPFRPCRPTRRANHNPLLDDSKLRDPTARSQDGFVEEENFAALNRRQDVARRVNKRKRDRSKRDDEQDLDGDNKACACATDAQYEERIKGRKRRRQHSDWEDSGMTIARHDVLEAAVLRM
ncbi:hypothetical protein LTR66_008924 [Elasticomyces elasticus]|nr:hypothetical protein LTR66_008924 [Elasticomyces elasticus]